LLRRSAIHQLTIVRRATFIRQQDRAANEACYPRLTFPEVYILQGGYSSFFASHRARCFPQNYVLMDDEEHKLACERGLMKMKRKQLSRAHTYALGQSCQMEDSPSRGSPTAGFMGGMERLHPRRTASS
jgi:hypothetical protein